MTISLEHESAHKLLKPTAQRRLPPEGVCTLFFFETVWWRHSMRPSSSSEFWYSSLLHHCRVWVWYWQSQRWSLSVSACWQDPAGSARGRQSQMYWRLSNRQRQVVCPSQEWVRGWWCRARGPHDWAAAEREKGLLNSCSLPRHTIAIHVACGGGGKLIS